MLFHILHQLGIVDAAAGGRAYQLVDQAESLDLSEHILDSAIHSAIRAYQRRMPVQQYNGGWCERIHSVDARTITRRQSDPRVLLTM